MNCATKWLHLHERAVLGATPEHLIHDGSVERLNKACAATRHDTNASMTFEQAFDVTNSYIKLFIVEDEIVSTTFNALLNKIYLGRQETKDVAKEMLKDNANEQRRESARDPWSNFDVDLVTKSVEEIS